MTTLENIAQNLSKFHSMMKPIRNLIFYVFYTWAQNLRTPQPHSITLLEQIKVWGEKNCGKKSSTKDKFVLMERQAPK
jgi:hypothetical protein